MIIFDRFLEKKIEVSLFKRKNIFIFGPRQAGKTTLAKKLIAKYKEEGAYFNCENNDVRKSFVLGDPKPLRELIGKKKIVVFDEAQTIENIGKILKLFFDTYIVDEDIQIIATGSSSFDLANKINEPMTGRSFEFELYPLSIKEIKQNKKVAKEDLMEYMRTGLYPEVITQKTKSEKELIIKNISTNYLYKDVYIYENIKSPKIFEDLIKMLAFQIGQLVSVNELSRSIGVSRNVIYKYLRLLEQAFVIKIIRSFSGNDRNELKKAFKVYFLDLGIRNAVIDNLSEVEKREDKGRLFENLFFLERLKENTLDTFPPEIYFWRTRQKLEIDFILYKNQKIEGIECKWNNKEKVSFNTFLKKYREANCKVIDLNDLIKE